MCIFIILGILCGFIVRASVSCGIFGATSGLVGVGVRDRFSGRIGGNGFCRRSLSARRTISVLSSVISTSLSSSTPPSMPPSSCPAISTPSLYLSSRSLQPSVFLAPPRPPSSISGTSSTEWKPNGSANRARPIEFLPAGSGFGL